MTETKQKFAYKVSVLVAIILVIGAIRWVWIHWPWEWEEEIKQEYADTKVIFSEEDQKLHILKDYFDFCSAPREEWEVEPAYWDNYFLLDGKIRVEELYRGQTGIIKNDFIATTTEKIKVIDCYKKRLRFKRF